MPGIKRITLRNFKSFRHLDSFEMRPINILIGANGSGKSNFLSVFELLRAASRHDIYGYVAQKAGASRFLFNGPTISTEASTELDYGSFSWTATLRLAENNRFDVSEAFTNNTSTGADELLATEFDAISYHFMNTDWNSPLRLSTSDIHDVDYLKKDGSNLAAYLLWLKRKHRDHFSMILSAIQLVAPFILDIDPRPLRDNERFVEFRWRQRGMEDDLFAYHLSDGTLRFICLAALLLQPEPPALIIIDEPELGLHPHAITILSGMLKAASEKSQVVLATQSELLIGVFEPEDVIVVEQGDSGTTLKRLDTEQLQDWLKRYTLGDLWQKNILGGCA
ncbi:MAG: AAA family ATPase [Rhodospirillales bacterium]|jgi:predicted ATPase|nr:AAA family ATPase [Rhodospirillales bacterium]